MNTKAILTLPSVKQLNKAQKQKKQNRSRRQRGGPSPTNLTLTAPVAKGRIRGITEPTFTNVGKGGDIRVSHFEYLTDIPGSVGFAVTTIPVNAGLNTFAPWLSGIAQRFESYKFEKLNLWFMTESSTAFTGVVVLAVDYDASEAAPTTKTQVMAYRGRIRAPAWCESCISKCSKEDLSKRTSYYVRSGAAPANTDIKIYDVGNWFVCTQGQAGTSTVGEVHIEYTVKLMTPQLGDAGIGSALGGTLSGTTNAAPFAAKTGLLPVTVAFSGTTTSISTITFTQPWQGIMSVVINGTGLVSSTPSGTATTAEFNELINGAGTQMMVDYTTTADIGQTLILTIVNTTITSAFAYFGQGDV